MGKRTSMIRVAGQLPAHLTVVLTMAKSSSEAIMADGGHVAALAHRVAGGDGRLTNPSKETHGDRRSML